MNPETFEDWIAELNKRYPAPLAKVEDMADLENRPDWVIAKQLAAVVLGNQEGFSHIFNKLYEGTLHQSHCNADHSGPVGNSGCSCKLGRIIKSQRFLLGNVLTTLEQQVEAIKELNRELEARK
jgi:hypothetical protein